LRESYPTTWHVDVTRSRSLAGLGEQRLRLGEVEGKRLVVDRAENPSGRKL